MSRRPDEDEDLARRARAGSREAADALFARHWLGAWRAAFAITGRRAAAEDVTQDAFERAFRSLPRRDERAPFGAWLHRIVVNRALDVMRAESRLTGLTDAEGLGEPEAEHADDRELLDLIAPLAPERRAVLVLRFGLGYPLVEIARVLDVPLGTVHSRLARALSELRRRSEVRDGR